MGSRMEETVKEMNRAPLVELKEVCLAYGLKQVLQDCSMTVFAGDRIALMGPSGSGKTTLLRTILNLCKPDSGSVIINARRPAAVFQEPRLLPWRTAAENVNAVLSDSDRTMPEAMAWLEKMELADAAGLYPGELSGGMAQRAAIARALAYRPDLLIMDEPFSALDEALAERMMERIESVLSGKDPDHGPGITLVMATHSKAWAQRLGCRIHMMNPAEAGF